MKKQFLWLGTIILMFSGLIFIGNKSSVKSEPKSYLPSTYLYNAGSAPTQVNWNEKKFIGTATTTGGVATFQVTTDGTSGGSALFGTINTIIVSCRANTASAVSVPSASTKVITSGKTITVNVITGTTLLALGATSAFAADGTVVDILIFGN